MIGSCPQNLSRSPAATVRAGWLAAVAFASVLALAMGCPPAAPDENENRPQSNGNNTVTPDVPEPTGTATLCVDNPTGFARELIIDGGEPIAIAPFAIVQVELDAGDHDLIVLPTVDADSGDDGDGNADGDDGGNADGGDDDDEDSVGIVRVGMRCDPRVQYVWDVTATQLYAVATFDIVGSRMLVRNDVEPIGAQGAFGYPVDLNLLAPLPVAYDERFASAGQVSKLVKVYEWMYLPGGQPPADPPDAALVLRALQQDATAYADTSIGYLLTHLPADLDEDARADLLESLLLSPDPSVGTMVADGYLAEYQCSLLAPRLMERLDPTLVVGDGMAVTFPRTALRALARLLDAAELRELWDAVPVERQQLAYDAISDIDSLAVAQLLVDLMVAPARAPDPDNPAQQRFALLAGGDCLRPGILQYSDVFDRIEEFVTAQFATIPVQEVARRREAAAAIQQVYTLALGALRMRLSRGDDVSREHVVVVCRRGLTLASRADTVLEREVARAALEMLLDDVDEAIDAFVEDWHDYDVGTRHDVIFRCKDYLNRNPPRMDADDPRLYELFRFGVAESAWDMRRWSFSELARPDRLADDETRTLLESVILLESDPDHRALLRVAFDLALAHYLATLPFDEGRDLLRKIILWGAVGETRDESPAIVAYESAKQAIDAGDDAETVRAGWLGELAAALQDAADDNRGVLVFNLSEDLPAEAGLAVALAALLDESPRVREVAVTVLLGNREWAAQDDVRAAVDEALANEQDPGNLEYFRTRLAILAIRRLEVTPTENGHLEQLADYLRSDIAEIAARAAVAFRFLGAVDGVSEQLARVFADCSEDTQLEVLSFTADYPNPPLAVYDAGLASESASVRRAAFVAWIPLAESGDEAALDRLRAAADSETDDELAPLFQAKVRELESDDD